MIKVSNTTSTTLTAGQVIPFTVKYNTNAKTSFDTTTNQIKINKAGYYDLNAMFNLLSTAAGNVSIQLYADGAVVPEAVGSVTFGAAGEYATVTITDIIRILRTYDISEKASLYFAVSAAVIVNNSNATVIEIR